MDIAESSSATNVHMLVYRQMSMGAYVRATLSRYLHPLAARGDAKGRGSLVQISFKALKLACPSRHTMMWSCTAMPSGRAIAMICSVIWMSARDGVGSPEG